MEHNMYTMHKDFLSTHLRSHIEKLNDLLNRLEVERFDTGCLSASLRDAEVHLRHIRKVCEVG